VLEWENVFAVPPQFLTQVAYIRMVTSLDAALPLFEKAAEIGKSAACHLNYGIALEAKELGMANVDKQLTSPTKGWTHNLEQAEEQYKSALMLQPG
jgi:tetratricopeptide (TPR) repeat protein